MDDVYIQQCKSNHPMGFVVGEYESTFDQAKQRSNENLVWYLGSYSFVLFSVKICWNKNFSHLISLFTSEMLIVQKEQIC